MRIISILLAAATLGSVAAPAWASFHVMQIEQVIGGVDGNTGVQAIQLRMRQSGQTQLQLARLVARDAAGLNPILLVDFTTAVPNGGTGVRLLAATSNFSSFTNPALTPDFVLTNTIPASYLAAGSLTFEDDGGTIYWRLSWGGAGYMGSGAGAVTNDADGNFNPPFAGPLPSSSGKAVLFTGPASASSTNNAADYALTTGSATFTKNNGSSGTIVSTVDVGQELSGNAIALGPVSPNPARGAMSYTLTLPRRAAVTVRLFDMAGRQVRTLVDRELSAGLYTLAWDGTDERDGTALSSGLYFLQLEADGVRQARRFVLLRSGRPVPSD
jgi:hypothetical protein